LHNCSLNLITEFVDKTELAQLLVSVYSKSGSASREKNNRRKRRKTNCLELPHLEGYTAGADPHKPGYGIVRNCEK